MMRADTAATAAQAPAPDPSVAPQDLLQESLQESPRKLSATVLSAGAIGNILEWYDFGLYGLFAPVLAELFFPTTDRIAALMSVYAGFAIGFIMRPIGGAVLGHFGDRIGRSYVLICSVVMMGITTTAIGLLPTYRTLGFGAPVLLLVLRILQGFSVGGEFTGSVAYLVENAPSHRRGLAGSFANIGSTTGILLAAILATLTTSFADRAMLLSFGWRIPFLLGGAIAALGFFLRRRLAAESKGPARAALPLKQAFTEAPRTMLWTSLFTAGYGVVNYLTMVFLPTYANTFGGIAEARVLQINTAAQALALVIVPIAGWLNDYAIRRRTLLIFIFLAEFSVAWACFALAHGGGIAGLWIAQMTFGVLFALVMGTEPAMLSEQFKGAYRLSGYSLCFNIGIGIAGGTAPIIATGLIASTGNLFAPAFYLMLASAIAAGAAYMLADRSRLPLH
jgi:MHS family proline/betaine transporter-like MFS transporter